jgi:hypothetical protein
MVSLMSNDSTFEVVVEQRMFNKGDQLVKRTEYYTEWAQADAAWCAYRDLIGIKNSGIVAADFIENKRTIVHKQARKSEGNLPAFGMGPPAHSDESTITLIDDDAVQS